MKGLSWIQKIFFFINIIVAFLLLLSTYGSVVEPGTSDIFYMLGLAYPAFLLINIIFVLYWLLKLKLHLFLSITIILFGYSNLTNLFAFNLKSTNTEVADFKLMSFNVRLFNIYRWFDEEELDDTIFEYIEKKSPDVIAFQEFINYNKKGLKYVQRMEKLGYRYHVVEPRGQKNGLNDFFGLITFSKFKITDWGIAFQYSKTSNKTACIYTDISINDNIIRVYNTHLNSLRFLSEDYQFVENITKNNEEQAIQKSKNIVSKIMVSAKKRKIEVESISASIAQSPYPTIVVGDFNEPPYLYAYPLISENLTDAFLSHGFGLGTTYDGISTIPGLRLDFMLHSKGLKTTNFVTGKSKLSDHRPIIGTFLITEQ